MGKIIFFDDERKTSNNKNLRMKQMTAVDMVRASQATLSKATVWKTRRIHLFGFVFVRKKWKLEADCSSLENSVGKVDSWKSESWIVFSWELTKASIQALRWETPWGRCHFSTWLGFKQNWFQYRKPMQFKWCLRLWNSSITLLVMLLKKAHMKMKSTAGRQK